MTRPTIEEQLKAIHKSNSARGSRITFLEDVLGAVVQGLKHLTEEAENAVKRAAVRSTACRVVKPVDHTSDIEEEARLLCI